MGPNSAWRAAQRCACAILSVLSLATGTRAAETVSLERGLGPPGPTAPAVHAGWANAVFDGDRYWVSYQSGLEPPPYGGAFFALRVTEDGEVLDPNGLLVARIADGSSYTLSAAPWGALATYLGANVLSTVRLGRDGWNADPTPRSFGTNVNAYPYPESACIERSCLLLWSSSIEAGHSATETHVLALDGCGEPSSDTEADLPFGFWKPYPAGDGYVLLGSPSQPAFKVPLEAFGLDALGNIQWGPVTLPLSSEMSRGFAQGRSGGLLAWIDATTKVLSTLVLGAGGEVGMRRDSPPLATNRIYIGDLAAEGDNFQLGLALDRAGAVLLLDATGQPLADAVPVAVDDTCTPGAPMVASGTRSSLATWGWGDGSEPCVDEPPSSVLARGPSAGAALTPVSTTGHAARMGAPALASDGDGYLAAWFEDRAGGTGVYTQALDRDGAPLEPSVLTIPAPLVRTHLRPAFVSFQGGSYVVELGQDPSVQDDSEPNTACEVAAATLTRGTSRAQAKLGVPGSTSFLSLEPLITRQGEDAITQYRLTLRITDRTSTTLGVPWMRETPYGATETNAVAAFDGVRFTVVWSYLDNVNIAGTPNELLSMQFDESGAPLAAEPLVLPGLGGFAPRALAAGGGSRLLVLAPTTSYWNDAPLSVVRLDESGALIDATPREFSDPGETGGQKLTATVFDGTAFDLALLRHDGDLHVARLGTDGALLAEGSLVHTTEQVFGGALASAGDGRALLGYSRFDRAPSYVSTHAFVRLLGAGGECITDRVCDDATCSDCCTRGCPPVPTPLACTVTTCDGSCPEGTHCESGLVCRPDPPAPAAKTEYTKGCGCRVGRTRDSRGGALLALGVTLLLAARRRARR